MLDLVRIIWQIFNSVWIVLYLSWNIITTSLLFEKQPGVRYHHGFNYCTLRANISRACARFNHYFFVIILQSLIVIYFVSIISAIIYKQDETEIIESNPELFNNNTIEYNIVNVSYFGRVSNTQSFETIYCDVENGWHLMSN